MKKLLLVFMLLSSLAVQAKDLNSRLGIGYRDAYPFSAPGIAAMYYPNSDIGLLGALGIDTQDQNSRFAAQVGLRRIIFKEENMNFFMGADFTLLSLQQPDVNATTATTNSGFELGGKVGGEFFLPGLENLGFSFETGIAVSSLNKSRFRTMADSPLRAGIIFYF